MDCINHAGVPATTYCQNCGKPFCNECVTAGGVRTVAGGQILCESCIGAWQNLHAPFAAPVPSGSPNPAAAAVLGFIPGVGAMYNAQYVKALIHVAVFVGIIALTDHFDYFGFFIPAWILYQVFDAYHTAKARRDGQPLPDPLGLNELKFGSRVSVNPQAAPYATEAQAGTTAPPTGAPYEPYQGTYSGGFPPMPPMPPIPPIPPMPPVTGWRRPEPIGAIILIALGVIFLLGQLDFFNMWIGRFFWPILLIALGVYLIVRRILCDKGASK
jgi:TM2 domain-containing membrane protein YozV